MCGCDTCVKMCGGAAAVRIVHSHFASTTWGQGACRVQKTPVTACHCLSCTVLGSHHIVHNVLQQCCRASRDRLQTARAGPGSGRSRASASSATVSGASASAASLTSPDDIGQLACCAPRSPDQLLPTMQRLTAHPALPVCSTQALLAILLCSSNLSPAAAPLVAHFSKTGTTHVFNPLRALSECIAGCQRPLRVQQLKVAASICTEHSTCICGTCGLLSPYSSR